MSIFGIGLQIPCGAIFSELAVVADVSGERRLANRLEKLTLYYVAHVNFGRATYYTNDILWLIFRNASQTAAM